MLLLPQIRTRFSGSHSGKESRRYFGGNQKLCDLLDSKLYWKTNRDFNQPEPPRLGVLAPQPQILPEDARFYSAVKSRYPARLWALNEQLKLLQGC
ncbi:unnamed protein product [Nesidiocoris tenuis]|uniref:Uncharacterized protein n=1 Tax=Nesidiocoris tenuis TaxID=355587 RepID=A0A6H5GMJ2_9HEMI|nr:unnamed protein product [Nesidiocoris tenuis]CAB0004315.1 unnamed protein product [Nesidiocoris tenuis]